MELINITIYGSNLEFTNMW